MSENRGTYQPPDLPPEQPKGIRDIDGEKINKMVDKVRSMLKMVIDRGIVVTPTILGVKVPITIKLGPKE